MASRRYRALSVACNVVLTSTMLISMARFAAGQSTPSGTTPPATGNWQPSGVTAPGTCESDKLGSPYIPVDSWVYPAVLRLYSLGIIDHVYLGMRPWTRSSVVHMLEDVTTTIEDENSIEVKDQAQEIYESLMHELRDNVDGPCMGFKTDTRLESVYSVMRGISGTPLRDSYHLGSSIVNDYGRPFEGGFNNYSGLSGYATGGRFTFYARGEFQRAPGAAGYSPALAQTLSAIDEVDFLNPATGLPYTQETIPLGPVSSSTNSRIMEAYISARLLNHEISFGKQDSWLGPGMGGGMAYSNNAEDVYSFRINRVEPLRIPLLSDATGPFRYDFMVGKLRGHTYMPNPAYAINPAPGVQNVIDPGDPWVHVEKLSFKPTANLELGFERTVIWGGKGHEPITLHTFLRSFFSLSAPTLAVKSTSADPGARFGAFDFSYRLPFLRKWLTLYSDSEVHDDISPIDAPRRASWRPGIYLSHFPGAPRLDLRVEAASTDPPVANSDNGHFMYYEGLQKQGYTNNGQLFGDWIGREDKGGQAWLTYHLSGNQWIQVSARNQKAAKDFLVDPATGVQYGSTLNDVSVQAVKRIGPDFEIDGRFTAEHYKEPIYLPGQQTVTTTSVQLTWYPGRKISF